MSKIKDRNGMDLTEANAIKKRWQEYTEELYKKEFHDPDNHDGVITHLEPDILECEVKWALESITTNKASGGDEFQLSYFKSWKYPPLPKNSWNIHAKMGSIKDRNWMDLTEAEDIKKQWQEYTEKLYKKNLHDQDNHDGVMTHLEPDILECEVKWALESITMDKANGGDVIPVALFQILTDDAAKVLHSICQQI